MTRADFYIERRGKLELIGTTCNNYNGPFEKAKTARKFREAVKKMCLEEGDTRDYTSQTVFPWPWPNSKLTDEVFIFRPMGGILGWLFPGIGEVWAKTLYEGNHKDNTTPAQFVKNTVRYDCWNGRVKDYEEYSGEFPERFIERIYLPQIKQ